MCKQFRPRSDCSWRSSLTRVYTICHSTMYFKKQLYIKHKLGQKVWNKVFEILGHLLYICQKTIGCVANSVIPGNAKYRSWSDCLLRPVCLMSFLFVSYSFLNLLVMSRYRKYFEDVFFFFFFFSYFCTKAYCGYSLEFSHWGSLSELPQYAFWFKNKNCSNYHLSYYLVLTYCFCRLKFKCEITGTVFTLSIGTP